MGSARDPACEGWRNSFINVSPEEVCKESVRGATRAFVSAWLVLRVDLAPTARTFSPLLWDRLQLAAELPEKGVALKLRMKIGAVTAGLALAITMGVGAAEAKTTESQGGGTHTFGVGDGDIGPAYAYSYYFHKTKTHSAAQCGTSDLSCQSSGWIAPNKWAKKDIFKFAFGNRSFWNVK